VPDAKISRRRLASLPDAVLTELIEAVGARRGERAAFQLAEAKEAFERDRFRDARTILAELAVAAPGSSAVRELLGLSLYRLGRFAEAARELEAYGDLTGATDELHVLADCHRALKHHGRVDEIWEELAAASPSADSVMEGRIVRAGSLADRRQTTEAISFLEEATTKPVKRLQPRHLRLWYALGDLYDRAGEVNRARSLFKRVASEDPSFADVRDRIDALSH
jgi:tetratricopeptide (TPR) repeat protein